MENKFTNEEAAQNALIKFQAESLGWCPIIRETCRKDCVCYYEGRVYFNLDTLKDTWRIYIPSCQNVMISGVINVE